MKIAVIVVVFKLNGERTCFVDCICISMIPKRYFFAMMLVVTNDGSKKHRWSLHTFHFKHNCTSQIKLVIHIVRIYERMLTNGKGLSRSNNLGCYGISNYFRTCRFGNIPGHRSRSFTRNDSKGCRNRQWATTFYRKLNCTCYKKVSINLMICAIYLGPIADYGSVPKSAQKIEISPQLYTRQIMRNLISANEWPILWYIKLTYKPLTSKRTIHVTSIRLDVEYTYVILCTPGSKFWPETAFGEVFNLPPHVGRGTAQTTFVLRSPCLMYFVPIFTSGHLHANN